MDCRNDNEKLCKNTSEVLAKLTGLKLSCVIENEEDFFCDNDFSSEFIKGIKLACDTAFSIAKRKGFWDNPSKMDPMHQASLFHEEVSEFSRHNRKNRLKEIDEKVKEETGIELTNEEVELADLIIRVFDHCGRHDLRLGLAIMIKMLFNCTREHLHGKTC